MGASWLLETEISSPLSMGDLGGAEEDDRALADEPHPEWRDARHEEDRVVREQADLVGPGHRHHGIAAELRARRVGIDVDAGREGLRIVSRRGAVEAEAIASAAERDLVRATRGGSGVGRGGE